MHTLARKYSEFIKKQEILDLFKKLYGEDKNILVNQVDRYNSLLDRYFKKFPKENIQIFSSPGRTEICGNHTDHNSGRVLAASINLDTIAVVSQTTDNTVTLYSDGFEEPFSVDLNELDFRKGELENTAAIIRGIAFRFKELGYAIGGFNAFVNSNIPIGSGLSSSASIEVLIATILNSLYNQNSIDKKTIAFISQFAENQYFGKPCGLMDQLSIAIGGIIAIDFKEQLNPFINKVDFDFIKHGLSIVVVDTGSNHSDLTEEYSAIPEEMKMVSDFLNIKCSCDADMNDITNQLQELRLKVGDRPILRMAHYITENERVLKQIEALENEKLESFLDLVNESGNSSFKWLQNCFAIKTPNEQGISLALLLTENFFKNSTQNSACRVHGGGFAGTIQAFIPNDDVQAYVKLMNGCFGENSAHVLNIRSIGAIEIKE